MQVEIIFYSLIASVVVIGGIALIFEVKKVIDSVDDIEKKKARIARIIDKNEVDLNNNLVSNNVFDWEKEGW